MTAQTGQIDILDDLYRATPSVFNRREMLDGFERTSA